MDLTPDIIITLSQNIDQITFYKDRLIKFLKVFPFEALLSLKFTESNTSYYCIRLLKKLALQEESYQNIEFTRYILEFAMMIVPRLRTLFDKSMLVSSLDLMNIVLKESSTTTTLKGASITQERICQMLITASKSKAFGRQSANLSADILVNLLEMQVNMSVAAQSAVDIIFQACNKQAAVIGMCVIARYILRSRNTYDYISIYIWICNDSCKYLKIDYDLEVPYNLLRCLNEFLNKYDKIKHQVDCIKYYRLLCSKLKRKSSTICKMCHYSRLHKHAVELLGNITMDFCFEENIKVKEMISLFQNESNLFKRNITQWPCMHSKFFFIICHMLYVHDRLLWKSSDILNAIEQHVNSPEFLLSFTLIKPIFFLFPIIIDECPGTRYKMTGTYLLEQLSLCSSSSQIYTLHAKQFIWILREGDRKFKINILTQWLKNKKNDEEIINILNMCDAGELLIKILRSQSDGELMFRAASLIRKLKDEKLKTRLASMMSTVYLQPTLLKYLVLAHPDVPRSKHDALMLCSVITSIIPNVTEGDILRGVFVYSKKLLNSLKDVPSSLEQFCKDSQHLSLIIRLTKSVNEGTTLEIIRILQLLIVIQETNHLKPAISVSVDLTHLLTGSNQKISKSLQLFRQMLGSQETLFDFEEISRTNVFHKLLSLTADQSLAPNVYFCLVLFVRRKPVLVFTPGASMLIEIECRKPVTSKILSLVFMKYLSHWLEAHKILESGDLGMVSFELLRNYILSSSIPNLKLTKYIGLLDTLRWDPIFDEH